MSAALIAERQKTHGDFADTAALAQALKSVVDDWASARAGRGQDELTDEQREALDSILVKIARIVAGDPDHADHWRDIAGYALLGLAYDQDADALGSYHAAIGEIGRRVKDGEEAAPTSGYFRSLQNRPELTLAEVIRVSLARSARWHKAGIHEWSVSDWAVAFAGEAGELCNAVKKLRRIETEAANLNDPGRQLDTREAAIAAIGAELADTMLYMPMLAAVLGIDLEAAVIAKFNATSERYGFPERLGQAPVVGSENQGMSEAHTTGLCVADYIALDTEWVRP